MIMFISFIILILIIIAFEDRANYQSSTYYNYNKSYFKEKRIKEWENNID